MESTSGIEPAAGPGLWSAADLSARDDWILRLDAEGLEDIAAALAGGKGRGLALTDIAAEDFPLPSMAGQLAAVKALLGDGPGVALLRGLPVDRYGRDDLGLILGGIGAHLGTNVPQSADGDMIVDVMDMSHTGDASRAYRSPRPQGLHCDSVDATGLLCLRRAKTGGTSLITSSLAVYNAILSERPELMAPLCVGYHYRRSGQTSTGEPALSSRRIPVFGRSGGRLVCYFNPDPIARALAEDGIENDPLALEAFEQFNATAAREDLLYRTMLEPGDLQFFNNRTVMHGRTAFEDFDEVARKRLMLRLWLRMPDWPDPPKDMILQRDRKTPKTAGAPV